MSQREITKKTPLLNPQGQLTCPGWARQMVFDYDPKRIHARPFALKEWDFYQLRLGPWILQLTLGHVSYAWNAAATLFCPQTGEQHSFSRLGPMKLQGMAHHPEAPHTLTQQGKGFHFAFQQAADQVRLCCQVPAEKLAINLVLSRQPGDEKMVIATPFSHPRQFYLNHKEHFYHITGGVQWGDLQLIPAETDTALLDWGRGVWPFTQEWYWGCGCGRASSHRFGFNIGWGFGDLSHATENLFFVDGKAYKLGPLTADMAGEDLAKPWHFTDPEGRFHLTLTPVYDNFTQTKLLWVNNQCHQVFGQFDGWVVLPDGQRLTISHLEAFVEHARNRW